MSKEISIQEIALLRERGCSVQEIADGLQISPHTIKMIAYEWAMDIMDEISETKKESNKHTIDTAYNYHEDYYSMDD